MTNPTKNFNDELLSAYVDGELTGEQLAQVEQQLADDPRARQLVEELRTLSQEFQSLPKETVGQDLRTTVLQRAERAMLLGSESPVVSKPRAASSSRRWAWAAMAIAASLMLSIYLPTSPQEEPTSLQEEKLASAKPVPRSVPRLEAADEGVDESLELKAVIAGETSASSTPSADRVFGRAAGGVGGLAAVPEESSVEVSVEAEELYVASQATPEVEPTCLVHITLNTTTDGVEQFNRLLVSQGILLRQNEAEKYEARDKNVSEEESVQDEMFLVEAPIEQIENVLEASNLDTSNYTEVRLQQQSTDLDHWRQWERSGKQLAQQKIQMLKRKAKSTLQTQQGWATRIDANQYRSTQQIAPQGVLDKQRGRAKKNAAKDPVQVLFILRAPTDR